MHTHNLDENAKGWQILLRDLDYGSLQGLTDIKQYVYFFESQTLHDPALIALQTWVSWFTTLLTVLYPGNGNYPHCIYLSAHKHANLNTEPRLGWPSVTVIATAIATLIFFCVSKHSDATTFSMRKE